MRHVLFAVAVMSFAVTACGTKHDQRILQSQGADIFKTLDAGGWWRLVPSDVETAKNFQWAISSEACGGGDLRCAKLLRYRVKPLSAEAFTYVVSEFNCKDGRMREFTSVHYNPAERPTSTEGSTEWHSPVEGSPEHKMWLFICAGSRKDFEKVTGAVRTELRRQAFFSMQDTKY
jgi:hypothetical protein